MEAYAVLETGGKQTLVKVGDKIEIEKLSVEAGAEAVLDTVLAVSDLFYEPKRGDVIVFHQTGALNEPVVKRVIATEGETVNIDFDTWTVTITDTDGNTFVLDEPYMQLDPYILNKELYNARQYPYVVEEGQVFVMGDNRDHSTDSRGDLIGPVDERRILGKVVMRVMPLNKFGSVE